MARPSVDAYGAFDGDMPGAVHSPRSDGASRTMQLAYDDPCEYRDMNYAHVRRSGSCISLIRCRLRTAAASEPTIRSTGIPCTGCGLPRISIDACIVARTVDDVHDIHDHLMDLMDADSETLAGLVVIDATFRLPPYDYALAFTQWENRGAKLCPFENRSRVQSLAEGQRRLDYGRQQSQVDKTSSPYGGSLIVASMATRPASVLKMAPALILIAMVAIGSVRPQGSKWGYLAANKVATR